MPKGVYKRNPQKRFDFRFRPGPAPSCDCGVCRTCKNRQARRAFYKRNAQEITKQNTEYRKRRESRAGAVKKVSVKVVEVPGDALEIAMIEYFKEKGWD